MVPNFLQMDGETWKGQRCSGGLESSPTGLGLPFEPFGPLALDLFFSTLITLLPAMAAKPKQMLQYVKTISGLWTVCGKIFMRLHFSWWRKVQQEILMWILNHYPHDRLKQWAFFPKSPKQKWKIVENDHLMNVDPGKNGFMGVLDLIILDILEKLLNPQL